MVKKTWQNFRARNQPKNCIFTITFITYKQKNYNGRNIQYEYKMINIWYLQYVYIQHQILQDTKTNIECDIQQSQMTGLR